MLWVAGPFHTINLDGIPILIVAPQAGEGRRVSSPSIFVGGFVRNLEQIPLNPISIRRE
jgi:hypothetical protein